MTDTSATSQNDPAGLPGVVSTKRIGGADGWSTWEVQLNPGADSGALLQACTVNGFALRGFESHKPSLHDVFIHLVGADQEIVK